MTSQQLRHEAQSLIKRLSPDELRIAIAFLAFLESSNGKPLTKRDQEAVASFKRAWGQVQKGAVKPVGELKWGSR